jgi:long-chain-fatty-acid--CoA ligase ACSBG
MPKAVMVSHDGYLYLVKATIGSMGQYNSKLDGNGRILSYLPLSHAAGQILDLILAVKVGSNVYFAHPSALQGTMPKYLIACKPYVFLYVELFSLEFLEYGKSFSKDSPKLLEPPLASRKSC